MSNTNHEHEHHVLPLTHYFGVYALLLVLTALTVAVSHWDLGVFALPVAMVVAVIKATCVAAIFMHLYYDNKFMFIIFFCSLFFVFLFFVFTMFDLGTRGHLNVEHKNFYLQKQQVAVNALKATVEDEDSKPVLPAKSFQPKGASWGKKIDPKKAKEEAKKLLLATGAKAFLEKCAVCHGAKGDGNAALKTPKWSAGEVLYGKNFASVFNIITNGSKKNPTMMAWKALISKNDRTALATYVLTLMKEKKK